LSERARADAAAAAVREASVGSASYGRGDSVLDGREPDHTKAPLSLAGR
jgi:hypothetical protein